MQTDLIGQLGKALVVLGVLIAAVGLVLLVGFRLPGVGLGRLPGDIIRRGKNGVFYFPVVTCLVVSAFVTLVLWALSFLARR